MMRRGIGIAVLAALAGCGAFDSVPSNALTECQAETLVPGAVKTDILFIVDDSGSMAAEQANLATSFDAFIRALAASPVKDDFQIGVTTTSVDFPRYMTGSSGFQTVTQYTIGPKAGTSYPAGALVGAPDHRILQASSPTLVGDFKANVNVGTDGSAKEQGFRAALLAVTDRIADGTNAGFLRPGARLAVIIVSDEDDCSDTANPPAVIYPSSGADACHSDAEQAKLPSVDSFVSALKSKLAGESRDVVVAVIAGVDPSTKQPVQPACNSMGYPAKRYSAFVAGFPGKGLIDDVCQADFTSTLQQVAGLIASQTLPLSGAPADPTFLSVSVTHGSTGTTTQCTVAPSSGNTAEADVIYFAPDVQSGHGAELTFQRRCALDPGDQVHVQVLCAR